VFLDENATDSQRNIDILEILDLSLLREFVINSAANRKSNVLVEALNRNFKIMYEHILTEGYSNVRAVLKRNNRLEIENEVA
jgi:hypothetical protein